jgi:flagellar biosynthesis/type III secretory pathway protein FliH
MYRGLSGNPDVQPFSFDRDLSGPSEGSLEGIPLETLEREAYRVGYAAGEEAGFKAGLEKAQALRVRLDELLGSLERSRRDLCVRLEEEMLALTVRMAEKVIHREILANRSSVISVLSAALKEVKEDERILVRVSPPDLMAVQEVLPELVEQLGVVGRLSLQEDPDVSPGGCVIETDRCEVDARVEKVLQKLEEALANS